MGTQAAFVWLTAVHFLHSSLHSAQLCNMSSGWSSGFLQDGSDPVPVLFWLKIIVLWKRLKFLFNWSSGRLHPEITRGHHFDHFPFLSCAEPLSSHTACTILQLRLSGNKTKIHNTLVSPNQETIAHMALRDCGKWF